MNMFRNDASAFEAQAREPLLRDRRPQWRVALGKPEQFEILDTWYTMGLKGTGSTDYQADSVYIPQEHTFAPSDKAPRAGSICKRPGHLLRKMGGVPLGVARDAIDRAIDVLQCWFREFSGFPEVYREFSIRGRSLSTHNFRYKDTFSMILVPFESPDSQLSNGTNFIKNGFL